jgi:hypothetical protein
VARGQFAMRILAMQVEPFNFVIELSVVD